LGEAAGMNPDDAVDRTIRNQRCRRWPGWLSIVGWGVLWMPAVFVLETRTPSEWRVIVVPRMFLLIIFSCVPLTVFLAWQPVRRLKLGDELWAGSRMFAAADICAIHLTGDPDEDYVESSLPVPFCQVTVVPRRGRRIRLVASAWDAGRLRDWAERKGIGVIDPEGYSAGLIGRETHR
jgi:hypothetical protein